MILAGATAESIPHQAITDLATRTTRLTNALKGALSTLHVAGATARRAPAMHLLTVSCTRSAAAAD